MKQQITLRLDAPIVDWFKRKWPKGYQTEINKALFAHIVEYQVKAREPVSKKETASKKNAG